MGAEIEEDESCHGRNIEEGGERKCWRGGRVMVMGGGGRKGGKKVVKGCSTQVS